MYLPMINKDSFSIASTGLEVGRPQKCVFLRIRGSRKFIFKISSANSGTNTARICGRDSGIIQEIIQEITYLAAAVVIATLKVLSHEIF